MSRKGKRTACCMSTCSTSNRVRRCSVDSSGASSLFLSMFRTHWTSRLVRSIISWTHRIISSRLSLTLFTFSTRLSMLWDSEDDAATHLQNVATATRHVSRPTGDVLHVGEQQSGENRALVRSPHLLDVDALQFARAARHSPPPPTSTVGRDSPSTHSSTSAGGSGRGTTRARDRSRDR